MPHQRRRRRGRGNRPNPLGVFLASLGSSFGGFLNQQQGQQFTTDERLAREAEAERVRQERFGREDSAAQAVAEIARQQAERQTQIDRRNRGAAIDTRLGVASGRAEGFRGLIGEGVLPEEAAVRTGFGRRDRRFLSRQTGVPEGHPIAELLQQTPEEASAPFLSELERLQQAATGASSSEVANEIQAQRDFMIAGQDPETLEGLAGNVFVQQAERQGNVLLGGRAGITPLEGDQLPDNAISFIVNSANELRSGPVTIAAAEAAQRSAIAMDLVGQLERNELEGVAQVDSALARAAVRYLEQDRLSDADYTQITGLDARTIQQTVRLAISRFVEDKAIVFSDDERKALIAIVRSGDELSRRMLNNNALFARQQATAIFGLPEGHPALDALVAPELPVVFLPSKQQQSSEETPGLDPELQELLRR